VAVDILQAGGNAADAAIAGAILLGICEPQMTGIGGDCFALVKPAGSEQILGLNGSGRAPAALSADRLRAKGLTRMPIHGIDTVTLPGAIDAFCTPARRVGPPAASRSSGPCHPLCRRSRCADGAPRRAPIGPKMRTVLQGDARRFYLQDGQAPRIGQIFRAPGQAEVLRRMARRRPRRVLRRRGGRKTWSPRLQALGGCHTAQDLAAVNPQLLYAIQFRPHITAS
ncbi:MAG: gamma-glutamyltransferase, partial [Gemmobacter sp.]|nr:gamma-glutamyltransferase [Gemmobacter sp.]